MMAWWMSCGGRGFSKWAFSKLLLKLNYPEHMLTQSHHTVKVLMIYLKVHIKLGNSKSVKKEDGNKKKTQRNKATMTKKSITMTMHCAEG